MTDALQRTTERVQDSMDEILANFIAGVKITVLVRSPDNPDADFCMTSDDLDEVIAMVRRRKGENPSPSSHVVGILQRIADEISALKLHPATGQEYDAGYIGGRGDAFAIVQEAIDNLPPKPKSDYLGLSVEEQKAQAERCGCRGIDDYCPCQNSPDSATLRLRAAVQAAVDTGGLPIKEERELRAALATEGKDNG